MPQQAPLSTPARILIVGADARAHTLAWILGRSPAVTEIHVAPGNAGTAQEAKARNIAIPVTDHAGLVEHALAAGIDLTVVSPEDPLAEGIVDRFRAAGLAIFGPTAAAARLESSKAWARDFMLRHAIPSPRFFVATDLAAAEAAIHELGGACVVKADGLAAGKGVVVADDAAAARAAAAAMLGGSFGAAGERLLIEERLAGPEISVMAITDGVDIRILPLAQDHKRLRDGDQGPNTGGMGSYAPAAVAPELQAEILARVVEPTLSGMRAEGHPFTGCLFCGLMLTADGPKVIEFNSRMGDPETQVQLPLLQTDLAALLWAAAQGRLADLGPLEIRSDQAAVCVVLASAGYPEASRKGDPIRGLAEAAAKPGIKVLHAGSRPGAAGPEVGGGRVLSVVAVAGSLAAARQAAYEVIDPALAAAETGEAAPRGVGFCGMQWRRDIAARALADA